MSKIRTDFSLVLAKKFLEDIQYKKSNYYYFLGKITPWNSGASSSDDIPPNIAPENNFNEDKKIRDQIIFVKKISSFDVSLVCRNIPWTHGQIYKKWDHTKLMKDEPFYVVTDEYKVYKCLDNFGNSPSTVKPTGNSIEPIRTSDGYLWKYMYTIPTYKRNKFISRKYIPVQRALSDSFYNKGSVESVIVEEGGSGYTNQLMTSIQINGTTTGSGGAFSFVLGSSGNILAVHVQNGGSGYTKGAKLIINSQTGRGAKLEPIITNGVITAVNVINEGSGYTQNDTIVAQVGGAILIPKVSRITGSIQDVIIVDGGAGYVGPPTLTVVSSNGAGTGLYSGNTSAILNAIEDKGSIVRVTISDPGKNYPVDTRTEIIANGDGQNAVFTPIVYNGKIIDVIVENSGEGYTIINLDVVGNGSGAKLKGVIARSDYFSDQAVIEQTSFEDAIYSIEVTNEGNFYSQNTTVSIVGDGTGCSAIPIIENGKIKAIRVINYGSGYTKANVIINDPSGNGTGATAYAIFPPKGGHGYDAEKELYASTLCISSNLNNLNILNLNEIDQDFRQYGIIKNPTNIFTKKFYKEEEALLVYKVNFLTTLGLNKKEILILNNHYKYVVVDIKGNTVYLQPIFKKNIIPIGVLTAESDSTRKYRSNKLLYSFSFDKYSGDLLYVSNERPFMFTEEQRINVKTFITF